MLGKNLCVVIRENGEREVLTDKNNHPIVSSSLDDLVKVMDAHKDRDPEIREYFGKSSPAARFAENEGPYILGELVQAYRQNYPLYLENIRIPSSAYA